MKLQKIIFPSIEGFDFTIKYSSDTIAMPNQVLEHHIHNECEIYVNVDGDVSFMVEDSIYPIESGNIIITRPYEYHHCIRHSKRPHEHFWILFSAKNNDNLLDLFFKRESGQGNLLVLSKEKSEELLELCHQMCGDLKNDIEQYCNFFKLLDLLQGGSSPKIEGGAYHRDLENVLDYISERFTENITVKEVATANHMSLNTLERRFEKALKTTPHEYIRNKRLAYAVKLLSEGESVTEASVKSGFPDCSAFITLFKKAYGVTPLKYKQQINRK